MIRHPNRLMKIVAALSASLAGVAGEARAQAGPEGALEEVLVTAKQREESLQDVPLSITAFTADAILKSQALDLRDIAALTPGLSFASGGGRTDPTAVAMRGVVPNTSDERFQGVSVFVDGVALSGQLLGLGTSQLERVEVLKGPQSATFGRATYSGAINYITRNPDGDEMTGDLRLRLGETKDALDSNYFVGASLTTPLLADRLWLGVSASRASMAGCTVIRAARARSARNSRGTPLRPCTGKPATRFRSRHGCPSMRTRTNSGRASPSTPASGSRPAWTW